MNNPRAVITKSQLINDLESLGVRPGQTVMLHASVRSVGWLVGGPDVILQALLDVLTPAGTLMMYVSWEEWERVFVFGIDDLPKEQQRAYREECLPFDPATSRAQRKWSILTEYLRTWPGAQRSNHPTASVAAVGARADWLTRDHPLAYGYGPGSPLDKLCQAQGMVLMLGSPLDTITLLHHAEHLADLPGKRTVINRVPILKDDARVWVAFEEFDTCESIVAGQSAEEYFVTIAREYLASGQGSRGKVGQAESYLFDAAGLVAFAKEWMEQAWSK